MIPINIIVRSLLTELGVSFCYYFIRQHGQGIIKKIDNRLLNLINTVAQQGKDFKYYCPKCKETTDLFQEGDKDKEFIQIIEECKHCNNKNIYLKKI